MKTLLKIILVVIILISARQLIMIVMLDGQLSRFGYGHLMGSLAMTIVAAAILVVLVRRDIRNGK
jgi:hypothetical protein